MAESATTQTDEQLMATYVAGDARAFGVLFQRYGQVLYRIVRRRLSNDDDARDIVQQTMLQMHRARADFRTDSKVRPWLFTIAMNLVREHYRRSGRRREEFLDREPSARDSVQPEQQSLAGERAARVRRALASLPEPQREVIELHWLEELPYEDIAQIVGASVAAVRVRAHRGYERLREILPDHE